MNTQDKQTLVEAMRYLEGLTKHKDKYVSCHYNCLLIEAKIAELELLEVGALGTYGFDKKCFISQYTSLSKKIDILSFRDKVFSSDQIQKRGGKLFLKEKKFDTQ